MKFKRADYYLMLIGEHCPQGIVDEFSGATYWVPGRRWSGQTIRSIGYEVIVGGGGDVGALNSLVRKGLITVVTSLDNTITYGWQITEEGRRRAQHLVDSAKE